MRRAGNIALIAVYLALITAPTLNMIVRIIPDAHLEGVTPPVEMPVLQWLAFRHERFQKDFVAWFEARYGMRGIAVKLDNTLNFHLFGELPPESAVRVGRGGMLYINEDVWFLTKAGANLPPAGSVLEHARRVHALQQRLLARGQVLLPIVVPSKTSVFPDEVPLAWRRDTLVPHPSDERIYGLYVNEFRRLGTEFVDAREMSERLKHDGVETFELGGRHWTGRMSCLVLEEAYRIARSHLVSAQIGPTDCDAFQRIATPSGNQVDTDLMRLANVWGMGRYPYRATEMRPVAPQVPTNKRPTGLFVGTSFSWELVHEAERNHSFRRIDFYCYDKTVYERESGRSYPVKPQTPGWRALTLSRDVYVLELLETYLPEAGKEFLGEMEEALEKKGNPIP